MSNYVTYNNSLNRKEAVVRMARRSGFDSDDDDDNDDDLLGGRTLGHKVDTDTAHWRSMAAGLRE
jgi:hypothetical protein